MNESRFIELTKRYADEKLDITSFTCLERQEEVERVEMCGMSGRYSGWIWYNVLLTNGDEFSVYCRG